jgi:hypothetical protein
MFLDWDNLPDELQLALAQEAMNRAAANIAVQAEMLANEIECGTLSDHGGPDALRLFAAVVRAGGEVPLPVAGHA